MLGLTHLHDGLVDLLDASALFVRRGGNLADDVGDPRRANRKARNKYERIRSSRDWRHEIEHYRDSATLSDLPRAWAHFHFK
ncbi:hypothetical protein [Burkholderia stagnalis]|uniref:hypothetical protein n=1 Tax=Burkholderia stagnalis TaxID=1503054 RepID=UPI0007578788|nr:hypothetical protein [Burkholderia stagnalis]KVL87865.1 hypothetical protein WT02_27880 [Burkholderia stagnalis]